MSLNKLVYTDTAVLSSAPPKYGRFCVDFDNNKLYCSFGIASPSDWVQIFPIDLSPFELLANKITSWGTPTDTQYPSAKLVKDSLDLKADLSGGKIPLNQLPATAITSVSVVASEVEQLALTVEEGDVVIRTDQSKTYIHNGGTSGTIADWTQVLAPTDGTGFVISVNGQTGSVTLTTADIADSTNKRYVTDAHLTVLGNTSGTNTGDQDLSSYATKAGTETLTNKRITPRVTTYTANGATPQINTDDCDIFTITEQTVGITGITTTGNPNAGDCLLVEITSTNTAIAFSTTYFEGSGTQSLPLSCTASTKLTVGFVYNSATSKWRLVGKS